jgi:uroporphyrinogen-III synthase
LLTIAIGSATAKTLVQHGVKTIIQSPEANSESLLSLDEIKNLQHQNILWVKGEHGRPTIGQGLEQLKIKYTQITVYQSHDIIYPREQLNCLWEKPPTRIILISSLKALLNLWNQIPDDKKSVFQQIPLLVFSPRIANEAMIFLKNPIFITKHDTIIESLISFQQSRST